MPSSFEDINRIWQSPKSLEGRKNKDKQQFSDVAIAKPPSSRDRSGEAFVVCRGFGGVADDRVVPFLERGDLSGYT